jgi:hypothetical protein
MKSSDVFGVAVRVIGLIVILYGLYDVWGGFDNFFENLMPNTQDSDANSPSTLSYFIYGVPEFIVGALLFFLADLVVKLAYRE